MQDRQQPRAAYYIYFMLAREADAVKIGVTHDLDGRRKSIQTCCPFEVEIIAAVPFGARQAATKQERRLHHHFDALWMRTEWFRFSQPLRDLVTHLREGGELLI